MPGDLWAFFDAASDEGFKIESSLCTGGQCNKYEGSINPDDILAALYLTSPDGKVTKEVKISIVDLFNPTIRLSMEYQGKDIFFEMRPEDCKVTEDNSCLYMSKTHQDCAVTIAIKAAKA